jgi:hypothetical protein
MSRNTGSVASSDKSWLKLYAAVAVLPIALTACGGGGGGSPSAPLTPSPAPTPAPTPAPAPTIGTTWTSVSATAAGNLTAVDYGNGHFVAVSDTGAAITSTDGTVWTPAIALASNVATDHFKANTVGHIGTTLVAAGSVSPAPYTSSTGAVATSTDGTTWTLGSLPAGSTPIHGLIAGTKLIALGEAGHLYISNDGLSWSAEPAISGIPTMNAGAYGAGAYLGVGDSGYMIRSVNGSTNWGLGQVVKINGTGVNLHAVAWTGSQFVVVGDNAAISTSTDGATWQPLKTSAISGTLRSVAVASNGTIVVVGDNGIETSPDGNVWTARNDSGVAALTGATFGNSEFVAVGAPSTVKTSSN